MRIKVKTEDSSKRQVYGKEAKLTMHYTQYYLAATDCAIRTGTERTDTDTYMQVLTKHRIGPFLNRAS